MANQADDTRIFIGRVAEIGMFDDMLKQLREKPDEAKWILNIHGPGGIGKTQLLQQYIAKCQERREARDTLLFTGNLADFYWTAHQRELGVFKTIAEQLGRKSFDDFFAALKNYQKLFDQAQPDPLQVSERTVRARDRFFEAYENIGDRPVAIFFDTAEQATEAILDTLFADFLEMKRRHPQTLIVIAGRQPLVLTGIPPAAIEQKKLAAFTPQEIQEYLVKQGIDIPEDVAATIAQLSEGKPILIVLAADWIRDGNDPRELADYPPDRFEQSIVEKVQKLNVSENQVMMDMAHFYRRFDEHILACLLGKTKEEAAGLTEKLSRFLVVKYRPPFDGHPGSCLLHDEMRELVNHYVWPVWDPMGDYRRKRTGEIVEYYAEKIKTEPDRMERQNLCQERLYYWLSIDEKAAFAYYLELAEQALTVFDADLLAGINAEVQKIEEQFKKPLDASIRYRYEYYQALSLHWRECVSEAVELLKGLLTNPQVEPDLKASIYAHLVEFYSDSGDPAQAIQTGLEGEKHFDGLLLAEWGEKEAYYQRLQRDFGVLCNNLGYAYRRRGNNLTAIDYYEKALTHFAASGGAYVQRARTENNLGFVLHQLRREDEALARVNAALDKRRKLQSPYELGLSYNVLGSIRLDHWQLEDARRYFEQARQAFRSAESERGGALVDIAYGRLLRQSGFHKERLEQAGDPQREEYQQAGQVLGRAIQTFFKLNDNSNLSEALNERGTLLRQQKRFDDAIACFEQSIALSIAIGNRYRQADNLQEMGILYELTGQLDKALEFTQQAIDVAKGIDAKYLIARAQRTLANVRVRQKQYDQAFEAAGAAIILSVMLDPEKSMRNVFYEEWMSWIKQLILQLPTEEEALKKTNDLIRSWEQTETGGRRPADVRPGFVGLMRSLASDYSFLKA